MLAHMTRKRIDQLLVERGFFESRAKARAAIEAGGVRVDGQVIVKPAETIADSARIDAVPAHPWVGRGALKLAHALALWDLSPSGKVVLDVGASTGGFTEVCLEGGARRVYAVDVGRDQLHPRLASDARVVGLEGLDARRLDRSHVAEAPQMIVCDASFIGLGKVLPAALGLAAPGADLIALVKPQFEVGRAKVGKGGIVRDQADRQLALDEVKAAAGQLGYQFLGETTSPITGGKGNVEFLLYLRHP